MDLTARLAAVFPLAAQLRRYRRSDFPHDFLAGTITAILLVPQTLAYGVLAGLPPQMGLYAAVIPPMVYALLCSSRVSVVGPVAVQSVMIAAAIGSLHATPEQAPVLALAIATISGLLLVALGLLRLGWLTNFVSHPVLSGFTTGAALYIVSTQLGSLMGISLPREATPIESTWVLVNSLGTISLPTALFGWGGVAVLLLARKPLARLFRHLGLRESTAVLVGRGAPILAVAIGVAVSVLVDASANYGVKTVGSIPRGLPDFAIPPFDLDLWRAILPSAVLIAIVGYIETVSVSKVLAFRRRERISADRELVALGMANLGAASCGAMPVAGGFTKSSTNFEAGAQTQVSSLVAGSWVGLSAALMTGLLEHLPRSILAAIIIIAVWKLIDFRSLRHNWSFSIGDGTAQLATIVGVLVLGVEQGLLVGVCVAAALFLYRTSRPNVVVVGRVPGTMHYRNADRRDVELFEHLLLVRIDESLYFANSSRVETELQRMVIDHPKATDVVLIMTAVGHVDASSLQMLENFEAALAASGMRLRIAEAKGPLLEQLEGTELLKRIGPTRIHLSTHDAVASMSADVW